MRMDFLKYFSYYSQKMMISPYYFGRPVLIDPCIYRLSQNSRNPNSERGVVGKDPVELEKYFQKEFALPEKDISTLILFNTEQPSYSQ
jgi:hypothetical protein